MKPAPVKRAPMARWAVPALLLLSGCTLIDQTTFDPQAGKAPVIPPAPKAAVAAPQVGPPPLLVIDTPDAAVYGPALRKAVRDARSRKPGVVFDVVEVQPPDVAPDTPLGTEAVQVARAIAAEGVTAANIRLVARPEAGGTPRQVRVYVR